MKGQLYTPSHTDSFRGITLDLLRSCEAVTKRRTYRVFYDRQPVKVLKNGLLQDLFKTCAEKQGLVQDLFGDIYGNVRSCTRPVWRYLRQRKVLYKTFLEILTAT